jgi:hypothetical protein
LLLAAALVLAARPGAAAQESPAGERTSALRVFLDCRSCDETYLRTEITFVNYVRDREVADLHLLVTTQATGGGGTQYSLKFIGLGRFKGVDQTLTYSSLQTSTPDETRRGLAATIRLGLVRYVAETPLASRLKVTFDAPPSGASADAVHDPWNFWVFRVGGSGNVEAEESQSQQGFSGSFSANRVTDRWKVNLNGFAEYEEEQFDLEEGETFTSVSRQHQGRALVVKSLNEHWSMGGTAIVLSSTFQNYELRSRFAPGIEYDIYPYSESTRRIFTVFYSVGVQTADYLEETIYGKTSETLFDHQLEATLALRQPWGTASASAEILQYLNQTDKYRLSAFGNVDVRLFKGFSLDLFGQASRRRDQLSLRRGDATTEEILVRQRELATGYQLEVGFGISYSFGSIFNNVVNPRFRSVGGL